MKCCATLPARTEPMHADLTLAHASPIVFVDGVPEPRLSVVELTVDGPLDLRQVELEAPAEGDADAHCLQQRWLNAQVFVALPLRLIDDQVRWRVLAHGRLHTMQQTTRSGHAQRRLRLVDDWQARLGERIDMIWWAGPEGALSPERAGRLEPGPEGNRSTTQITIAGRLVHVLEHDGEPWTVGTALASVSAMAGLELSLALLPRAIAEAALLAPVDLAQPMARALKAICEPYGLVAHRDLRRDGSRIIVRCSVRSMRHGRPMRLRWAEDGQPLSDVLRLDSDRPTEAAQQWIARAAGWLIESTFNLVGGWSPALEGEADSAYGRATSSDFATYANVYRYWALNEDGYFSKPPYERETFDLAGFFASSDVRPQPLPWQACVARSDSGEARPAIVQISTDSGASWAQYPGRVRFSSHRAAVYLDDDALPDAFLAAAKLGAARVRVAASLRSPQPVDALRWRGNAFAGARPARVLDVGQAFLFRRVHEQSIHHDAVRAGVLTAAEQDQSRAMQAWLVDRMQEHARVHPLGEGRGRIELSGVRPLLRLGDRLLDAGGAGRDADGSATAIARQSATVVGYQCRFVAGSRSAPGTTVHVRF